MNCHPTGSAGPSCGNMLPHADSAIAVRPPREQSRFVTARWLIALMAWTAIVWHSPACLAQPIASKRPNIVFVLTDDQGYGDVSVHGNPTLKTPHLDRMHSESVRLTDFHVSPTCSPTRSALWTGRHEFFNGVTHTVFERERLSLASITLAQVLQQAGYTTGIFGKWHLGDEDDYQPGRRGFDEVFIHGAGGIGQSYPGSCGDAPGNTYFDPFIWHNDRFVKTEGFCTDVFFQQAMHWMDQQRQSGKPFLATISTNAPHSPYTARPEDAALYKDITTDKDTANFFGMIHNIDENVGRLLDSLSQWGIDKDTLVVMMNDNGTAVGQRIYNCGMRGNKGTAWLGGTRAISFWHWPGTLTPGDCSALTAHIDFFPTIAEIAGVELNGKLNSQIQGRSLTPLLMDPRSPWEDRLLFTHLGRWPKLSDPDTGKYRMAAVRNSRWSLVSPDGSTQPNWQLYDLSSDYGQQQDVIEHYPEVANELMRSFEDWWQDAKRHMVNELEPGPSVNSFAFRYWQQFGGKPSFEDRVRMAPSRPWPTSAQPGSMGRYVNPMIGTGGISFLCGNNFPGATAPFGMVRLSPDTISERGGRATNMSGYYFGDRRILGFSHTRLVGTGAIDGGCFMVVPSISGSVEHREQRGARYQFSHEFERAFPGYYSVWLPEPNILAELTATTRVGVHRYTFPANLSPRVQIHVSSVLGKGRTSESQVRISDDLTEIEGSVRTFGSFSSRFGGSKVYFVARFNRPVVARELWSEAGVDRDLPSVQGSDVGIELAFAPSPVPQTVELQMGLSYVSTSNARENLEREVGEGNFDHVQSVSREAWEKHLSKVLVEGGSQEQRTIFYSALYRSLNMPTTYSDVNGQYLGFDKQVHQANGFTYYTDMSLWDTFRTTHPLYTILFPDRQREMLVSLVEMSKQGGFLPRWPSGSGYTNSMFGTPADFVVAESYLKGIHDFDVQAAYQKMNSTALAATPPGSAFSGRSGVEHYINHGYCPSDLVSESVSKTLEYCYADFAMARLAEALGHSEDVKLFDQRAQNYRNLWNPETQYFHPRDSQGRFQEDFRPLMLTYTDVGGRFTGAYVEGSPLQWRWAVPHHPDGLISLFKSREYFIEQLEEFFSKSLPHVGRVPNAYYWQGNQPDLFAAYLFNSAGRPDLTDKWVRWILENKYGAAENGLDGNDDGGTLSAWYVLSSLGVYPVAGTDRYELTLPLWDRSELDVGDHKLVIRSEKSLSDNRFSRRVHLNGQQHLGTSISHGQWIGSKEVVFEVADH